MIRRSIFSLLGGALFAAALFSGSKAMASCQGQCAEMIGMRYVYVGCVLYLDGADTIIGADCYYYDRFPAPAPSGALIAE